ncbi:MAG: diacylglycerol kinase family protein [Marinobacter sp.]|uniref:diacylglycerol/lipid kinase family protein n=1 Tax=Marinobacter sp. TaxID=50741 RepID=UPI00299F035B|nr:diacylglycerol kinase family protein [Marinobacter sp.]MDX1634111.1 diacylglycerol kinase family protein [Marinobacter sp.]
MHTWLITNPRSGSGERNAAFWGAQLREAGFSSWTDCDLTDTSWSDRVEAGDRLLVAGGDGSVNRAASLALKTGAILGVLPSGTANDFARHLNLPDDPIELCRLMYRAPVQRVDVSWLNQRLFLNVAHIGLGTWPTRDADDRSKRLLGRFSYGAVLIRRLWVHRGFHADIQGENARLSGRWLSIAIANGVFYGGGNQIPESRIDDGCLDIVAVRPRSRLRLIATYLAVGLLRLPIQSQSTVVHLKSRWCRIRPHRQKLVTADGEEAGHSPVDVQCDGGALKVVSAGLWRPF